MLHVIIVGFVAGIIARLLSPGPNNPSGFILTTVLGIAGAFLATAIGQAIGHYEPDQGAGGVRGGDVFRAVRQHSRQVQYPRGFPAYQSLWCRLA